MTRVIGWDLGGANVKLASIEDGRVASVAQIPCPIIPERRKFDAAVEAALPLIALPASHAVTMTGELSDVFGDRAEGVAYLVDLMVRTVGAQPLSIYAGEAGFLASRATPNTARSKSPQPIGMRLLPWLPGAMPMDSSSMSAPRPPTSSQSKPEKLPPAAPPTPSA